MKTRITPTDKERVLGPNEYIISTTDTHGCITSVNDVLVEYSGYTSEELMGMQHNIVRHPDMPRSVFWLAWETLREGDDFYGYVKNLCKDGSFYWVFAHIRPEHDSEGEITGYRSVRRAPKPAAVKTVEKLYEKMLLAEQAAGTRDAIAAGSAVLSAFLGERGVSYEQLVARL